MVTNEPSFVPRKAWFGHKLYMQERSKVHHYVRKLLKDGVFQENVSESLEECTNMTINELAKEDVKWAYMGADMRKHWVARYWSLMKCVAALTNVALQNVRTKTSMWSVFSRHQVPQIWDSSMTTSLTPHQFHQMRIHLASMVSSHRWKKVKVSCSNLVVNHSLTSPRRIHSQLIFRSISWSIPRSCMSRSRISLTASSWQKKTASSPRVNTIMQN